MILSPYTKKVEIYVGYRGFYTCGDEKVTITVEENGIGAIVDTRSGQPGETGYLIKLFKPMQNLEQGKKYIEQEFLEVPLTKLKAIGFFEVKAVKTD